MFAIAEGEVRQFRTCFLLASCVTRLTSLSCLYGKQQMEQQIFEHFKDVSSKAGLKRDSKNCISISIPFHEANAVLRRIM